MKFIADAMLGRLAKWLRLMGFDVLYYPRIDDRELVKISREQERTVITRDSGLIRRKSLRSPIFINSEKIADQLEQMKTLLDFRDAAREGRCQLCNGVLRAVTDRRAVRELVPEFVYLNACGFVLCEGCGKVYWQGSHSAEIREIVGRVLGPAAPHETRN